MNVSIIFITNFPFSKRDYDRFGIETLEGNGINTFVFDCTKYFNIEIHKKYFEKLHYPFKKYFKLSSKKEILDKISSFESQKNIFVDLLPDCKKSKKIRWIIKKSNMKLMKIELGLLPKIEQINMPIFYRCIKKIFNPIKFIRSINLLLNKIIDNIFDNIYKVSPDILLLSGKKSNLLIDDNISIIWAHAFDYDNYLKNKSCKTKSSHIVFIDEDIISHSDYIRLGIKAPIGYDAYFPKMAMFFDDVEKISGLKVIIAAHPRSSYKDSIKPYGNRQVIISNTAELIRNAKLVLCHSSTAVNYAILWEKPVAFLTMDRLTNSWRYPLIKSQSNETGGGILNIDNIKFNKSLYEEIILYDKNKYSIYKENYIKKNNTSDKPIWNIVTEYLYSLEKNTGNRYV